LRRGTRCEAFDVVTKRNRDEDVDESPDTDGERYQPTVAIRQGEGVGLLGYVKIAFCGQSQSTSQPQKGECPTNYTDVECSRKPIDAIGEKALYQCSDQGFKDNTS